jgi:uncharacterized protein (DUF2236 family)
MLISSSDLERQLLSLQESSSDASRGLFGPNSMLWTVNRESVVYLGAGRALLLQLSHPIIAAAVAQHSTVLNNPLKRLHQTFSTMFKMVFGTIEQSFQAARALHHRHSSVQGHLAETIGHFAAGTPYSANDARLLQWVHSTLIETASLVYTFAFPKLASEEQEQFYQESRRMAGLFGLTGGSLPPTWGAFRCYFDHMWQSGGLSASRNAKDLVGQMFGEHWSCLPRWYQAVTAQLLPPPLRTAFQLPYGKTEQVQAERAWKAVRWTYPLLPYHLRYVGPYQEAQARIERKTPGLATKSINRIWIGRSTL